VPSIRAVHKAVLATGPLHAHGATAERRADLAELLEARMGVHVDVVTFADYATLEARLNDGALDLAWLPPALAVRAADAGHATMLAETVRAPGAYFYGTLYVLAASPWNRAEELRGTRVGWVDRDSCSGYLFPRQALVLRGLDPATLFASETFCGSHARVARALVTHEIDVGATFLNMDMTRSDSGAVSAGWYDATEIAMRPLMTTDPIPSDVLCAGPSLDAAMRARALDAIIGLADEPRGQTVLREFFSAHRFEPADERRYSPVRAALRT
jgi:phosphonate transport system substrate-binding protein